MMPQANGALARPTHVMLVEDDGSDAYLVQSSLDKVCPGEFSIVHARSLEEALPCLVLQKFDVALLDLSLPGLSELEALNHLQNSAPQLPVVILTGRDDEAMALGALKKGAQDFLVKEHVDGQLIKRAIRYAIESKHFVENLTLLANYDPLTGLANRALFESRVEMALARAKRSGETLGILFMDLDRFKPVNDRLGHEAGDLLLKGVASRLRGCLRECDTIARFGGDEFAVLLEGMNEPRSCAIVAQKMIDTVSLPFTLPGGVATVDISIGIGIGAADARMDQLLSHADTAMYRAKAIIGSNYQFYTERMHRETTERLQLEHELMLALSNKDALCIYYQPKLDIASGWLAGAEALIRWEHPTRGLLAPAEFLPLLQPAMASELDMWVLETVCRDIQCWLAAGLKSTQVSIHVASRQWENMQAAEALFDVLRKSGLETDCIAVEMEEAAIMHYGGNGFDVLSRVRETGMEVHLDNFGADISSLKLLTRCPLDAIKIDRRLTGGIEKKEQHVALVRALIELGHQLGMRVVAEGVETEEQKELLTAMQCDQIQGLAICKPLPANDFFQWMGRQAKS